MLTRKEIADMLSVTVDVFRRRVEARPDFPRPAVKLSKKTVRWEPGDVLKWIARQKSAQS
jgi:predicted DNA-binding transcriptional regulator AlpA